MNMKVDFRLKEVRIAKGLSQKELGGLINASQASISRWENKQVDPDLRVLFKLCVALHVSSDYLLSMKD